MTGESPHKVPYLWDRPEWPVLQWDTAALLKPLSHASERRGQLFAKLESLGLAEAQQVETLIAEAVTTSAIEGTQLAPDAVRSSVVRRLGLDHAGLPVPSREVDGVVEMLLDATTNYAKPLTARRLWGWQAALFPTGYSGLEKIVVGNWRDAPMQVLSGAYGRERVNFEAPPPDRVPGEMNSFIEWWSQESLALPGMIRAAVAHLRFETVHPFEDGNGRVGRALIDMALAQEEDEPKRFYSLSAQLHAERDAYYREIEHAQRTTGDITRWIDWFLARVALAITRSETLLRSAFDKDRFWRCIGRPLNARQTKAVNRLLEAGRDGFEGGLTNKKYRAMTRAAPATATRDLVDLLELGAIVRKGEGRAVRYELNWTLVDTERR